MASWMIHFRVANAMLEAAILEGFPPEAITAFVWGNVAPDSGAPTPDGGYSPNKNTSHFMRRFEGVPPGQIPERCDPRGFAETWLTPAIENDDPVATAFYAGYLCHLVTDNAWVRDFIYPAKVKLAHLRLSNGVETPEGVARFYAFLKRDWYDMDFLFVKHRDPLPAYRLFLEAPPFKNTFLPFFPEDAFEQKRREIEAFYRRGAAEAEDRETYLTEEELEAFIRLVRDEILAHFDVPLSIAHA